MPKWLKVVIGLALVPFCLGAVKALGRVLYDSGQAQLVWIALGGGLACWIAIYLLCPKPMWVYVFGHELTHVLWSWLFGGRVRRFKVSSRGGHVLITKSNFLVVLAPYFFPLYTLLILVAFCLGDWLWGWQRYSVWFHWLVGLAYGFHVTLTWRIIRTTQSDITSQGTFFSMIIIFLGNMTVLLIGLPLLSGSVTVANALAWWGRESVQTVVSLVRLGMEGVGL